MVKILASAGISYLFGSISPAYFWGKILKRIDIREVGEKNAGTINTYKILGPAPAAFTALFDLSKGLISAFVALRLGVPYPYNFLISYFAVLGHVFPFYLRFRGGQGEATSMGIILYFAFFYLFTRQEFLDGFLLLLFYAGAVAYITKFSRVSGLLILPILYLVMGSHSNLPEVISLFPFFVHTFTISLLNRIRTGYRLSERTRTTIKWSRFIARPFAVLYILIYYWTSKNTILILTGIVAGVFLIFDLVRLSKAGINRLVMTTLNFAFKSQEEKTFSSMTHFTVSAFLSFLIFPKEVACCSVLFPVFGDMAAKLMGLEFGRHKIFEKTLEGSIAYVAFSMVIGYVFTLLTGFPFVLVIFGAIAGAVSEVLPWKLDDNLSGTLFSAITMFYFEKF